MATSYVKVGGVKKRFSHNVKYALEHNVICPLILLLNTRVLYILMGAQDNTNTWIVYSDALGLDY